MSNAVHGLSSWVFLDRGSPRSLSEKIVLGELVAAVSLTTRDVGPNSRLFVLGLYDDPSSQYIKAWGDFVVHDEQSNRAYLALSLSEKWMMKDSYRECVGWLKGRRRFWVPAAWGGP